MRTSQLKEHPSARFNLEAVPRKIEIKLPDELYEMLERWADIEGISLSDLMLRELGRTEPLDNKEASARIEACGPSNVNVENIVRYIREGRDER
jgi:predicted CopG family antitoxin